MKTPTLRYHIRSSAPSGLTLQSILSDSELQALASKLDSAESLYIVLSAAKRELSPSTVSTNREN